MDSAVRASPEQSAPSRAELGRIDACSLAANYLSVGQIYLLDNPLLCTQLTPRHIKPRLLGRWGRAPGQSFIHVHLNRIIKRDGLDVIYISGPGHGGPALVANTYLEGTYSELYPETSQDEAGVKRLFKQLSFPGGIPSHVAPEAPGSIHEGGELGHCLSQAYGAALDSPDLLVACVVGHDEAEGGPLATGWHGNKLLNPATDGTVLPNLHLNGYKIAAPTVLVRIEREELEEYLRAADTSRTTCLAIIRRPCTSSWPRPWTRSSPRSTGFSQRRARLGSIAARAGRPSPLQTPKGWTRAKVVDAPTRRRG